MRKIILVFILLTGLFATYTVQADGGNGPWSLAAGFGYNAYTQGGSGNFGQGFVNVLYDFVPKWEVGLGDQFGANLNQVTAEIDYKICNFYFGIQGGPVSNQGNTGFGAGPMLGYDYSVASHLTVGGLVLYQWINWNSGTSNTGTSSSSMFSPFIVLTYQL